MLVLNDPSVHLFGRRLTLFQLAWAAFTLALMLVYLFYLPVRREFMQQVALVNQVGLSELKMSAGFLIGWVLTADILTVLLHLLLAGWLMTRQKLTRMAVWAAFMFMLNAITVVTPMDSLSNANQGVITTVSLVHSTSDAMLVLFFTIFPDGRFRPAWTRLVASAWAAWIIFGEYLSILRYGRPPYFGDYRLQFFTVLIMVIVGLGVQIYRYLNLSRPAQRQQVKWALLGTVFASLGVSLFLVTPLIQPALMLPGVERVTYIMIGVPILYASASLLPVTFTLAILRYRLWNVDILINRSLVAAGLTLLLVGLFAASLLVIERIAKNMVGSPLIAVAISASVFGAFFQPARRRLQHFVDERFYHIHIDYRRQPEPTAQPVLDAQQMAQVIRQTHFASYKDLQLLGRGGMSEVYRAIHPTLNRPVSIKLLQPHLVADTHFTQRFLREARLASGLEHNNIVRIFDYGEEAGVYYMVMEYLTGPDLCASLKEKGKFKLAELLPLLTQIASGLDYAHKQRLVHRDVKPSNILLDYPDGKTNPDAPPRAVLTDFGLAKLLGGKTALTGSGVIGTLDYIAPEQIRGAEDADHRADLYSLGVMAYQMLTGELPFRSSNPGALLIAHLTQPPIDPCRLATELPPLTGKALLRALAKKPEDRYANAGEFVDALKAGLS